MLRPQTSNPGLANVKKFVSLVSSPGEHECLGKAGSHGRKVDVIASPRGVLECASGACGA